LKLLHRSFEIGACRFGLTPGALKFCLELLAVIWVWPAVSRRRVFPCRSFAATARLIVGPTCAKCQHCRAYSQQAQERRSRQATWRIFAQNHGQSPSQVSNSAYPAGQCRQYRSAFRQKIQGIHNRRGVFPATFRQEPNHPCIAALLFGLPKIGARQPQDWMPPEDRSGQPFQKTNPMVAPTVMGEFMHQQGSARACLQLLP
jgi:hypothetical protein